MTATAAAGPKRILAEGAVVYLAQPRGFCAGVDRAIEVVERALAKFGAPIYVRHEIVHNTHVVQRLQTLGAVFIETLDAVPAGATLVFSAHGVPQAVRREAQERGLRVFDATCPLVTKVHVEVAKLLREGYEFLMIGHRGHPEVEGTMGQLDAGIHLIEQIDDVWRIKPAQSQRLALVTQTTLSVDDTMELTQAIRQRFPGIREPKQQDICYATQNRQDAVKTMCSQVDVMLVVGSPNSSNTNRLAEVSRRCGIPSYRIDSASDLHDAWLSGCATVGVTAGASAPEILVDEVVARLRAWGATTVQTLAGKEETVKFPLPKGLRIESA
ncbi:4-hydroxy-3-methylbut-2-enyl diphosphate reductase [Candidatus Symbiobacter mobilis]|uniref:4-hydroxy-3-methylbut-2-enyl diphosphate reductase n=1 Tax=Candidatus Symbiobacter mobilis CR TaxID=946483 RepID=U5NEP2_9BURK|nr:4-hydroxy-3-methylbut-2-enyl diphosphate reductase [Candidatus Symbiobacter mobilis]AGX88703.1 4-hydroxy-3-methylbut-2-enyl diphosphate reductase [Candidatus Symbiobacter mobilis CR]